MHQPWGSMFKMEWERARDVGTPVAQAAEKELPTAQRSETARVEASANQSSSAAAFWAASSVASSAAREAAPEPASNKQAEEDESKHRMPRACASLASPGHSLCLSVNLPLFASSNSVSHTRPVGPHVLAALDLPKIAEPGGSLHSSSRLGSPLDTFRALIGGS